VLLVQSGLIQLPAPDEAILMTPTQVVLTGTWKPDNTLELDEKPNLPPGRVRVTLELVAPESAASVGWWDVLQQMWKTLPAGGASGRTKEQIDTELDRLRGEWEERLTELDRHRTPPEQPAC
jgi:hypothetical protein